MSEIKIEKGIKPPSKKYHNFYPWKEMEVGESFFIKDASRSLFSQANNAGLKFGRKFSCRSVDGGVRVWRIK